MTPRTATIRIPRAGTMTPGRFAQMRAAALADFTQRGDDPKNKRTVRCRVCGAVCGPRSAHGYDEYMTDGYRFVRRYVCGGCFESTASPAVPVHPGGHQEIEGK